MNDYIINPWLFYLLSMLDSLLGVLTVTAVVSTFALFFGYLEYSTEWNKKDTWFSKYYKYLLATIAFATFAIVFIPSSNTVLKMYAASVVTKENIKTSEAEIINLITTISNAVKENKKK